MKLNRLFQDHMVLQRNKEIRIYGEAEDKETITATLDRETRKAEVKDGRFTILFPAKEAANNLKLTVQSDYEKIEINDILIGEVYVAGGQSNIEFFMRYATGTEEEKKICQNRNIRFFDYPEVSYAEAEQDYNYEDFGFWRLCDNENLEYYSAVAYYFAKELQKDLNVPIGIIGCNWGGTTASCWMSEKYLKKHGKVWIDDYENALKNTDIGQYFEKYLEIPMHDSSKPFDEFKETFMWPVTRDQQFKITSHFDPDPMLFQAGPRDYGRPCGLYEMMLKKICQYPIRGFIYYQGESDDIHCDVYDGVFSDLIDCWRDTWGEELPFLFVQLAHLAHGWITLAKNL